MDCPYLPPARCSLRGLVACANQNQPNSNGSQFFITLEKTDWLDRQNTIFGKIVGDTIYNLLRIGECGVSMHATAEARIKAHAIAVTLPCHNTHSLHHLPSVFWKP